MKFTLSWLKEELETDATVAEITDALTMAGLELESLDDPSERLREFVVAHVEKAEKHPDADRLKVCTVNNGTGIFEVVCGAPNVRAGMKGIFAGEGMYIPGIDVTLKKSKIRGVTSNGMLLSEREMGLSDDHDDAVAAVRHHLEGRKRTPSQHVLVPRREPRDAIVVLHVTPTTTGLVAPGRSSISSNVNRDAVRLRALLHDPGPRMFASSPKKRRRLHAEVADLFHVAVQQREAGLQELLVLRFLRRFFFRI